MRLLLHPAHISGRERHGAVHMSLLRSELRQAAGRWREEEGQRAAAARSFMGNVVHGLRRTVGRSGKRLEACVERPTRDALQSPLRSEVTAENMAASSKAPVVLKAVKKIAIQFCPFETNVRSTREFLLRVGSERVRSTNMNCEVVSVVKHDKSEPIVDITYVDGEKLVLKGAWLTSSEMLNAFQSMCKAKDAQTNITAKK
ncbi:hypothetical protein ABVT39_003544 [Epinephelus coioides]